MSVEELQRIHEEQQLDSWMQPVVQRLERGGRKYLFLQLINKDAEIILERLKVKHDEVKDWRQTWREYIEPMLDDWHPTFVEALPSKAEKKKRDEEYKAQWQILKGVNDRAKQRKEDERDRQAGDDDTARTLAKIAGIQARTKSDELEAMRHRIRKVAGEARFKILSELEREEGEERAFNQSSSGAGR